MQRKIRNSRRLDVVQLDWDGKLVWKFGHTEFIEDGGGSQADGWRDRIMSINAKATLSAIMHPG